MVILDSNIIIDHLRTQGTKNSLLEKVAQQISKENLALSVISIQELFAGISTRNAEKEKIIWATLAPLKIIAYSTEVAELAGKLERDMVQPLDFVDAAIAATAILNAAELFTLNEKHFQKIPGLQLFQCPKK